VPPPIPPDELKVLFQTGAEQVFPALHGGPA
jgi:hypothetical protein